VENRENYRKKKEFITYTDTSFKSPVSEISWNLIKQLKKGS